MEARSGARTTTLDRDVATYLGATLASILPRTPRGPKEPEAAPAPAPAKPEPEEEEEEEKKPEPPKKKGGIEITEIEDVPDDQEEYDPGGDDEADPFQNVHAIESCENLFFGTEECRQCVVHGGEVQINAVVDLSEEDNEFLATWEEEGVEHMELGEDALNPGARLDEVVEFIAKNKENGLVLIFDSKRMLRSAAMCVMFMMAAEEDAGGGQSLTTAVQAIEEDLDPIEHHIWRSKKIKGWMKAKAGELSLDDDTGEVFLAREKAIKAADKFGPK